MNFREKVRNRIWSQIRLAGLKELPWSLHLVLQHSVACCLAVILPEGNNCLVFNLSFQFEINGGAPGGWHASFLTENVAWKNYLLNYMPHTHFCQQKVNNS